MRCIGLKDHVIGVGERETMMILALSLLPRRNRLAAPLQNWFQEIQTSTHPSVDSTTPSTTTSTETGSISILPVPGKSKTSTHPSSGDSITLPSTTSTEPKEKSTNPPTTATSIEAPAETASLEPELKCRGLDNMNWVPRDRLRDTIEKFCKEAEEQGVQDTNSGSLLRKYDSDTEDSVELSIDWPSGSPFKPEKLECLELMSRVMDSCDANPDSNHLNWKHGGNLIRNDVKYNILPRTKRYKAGECSMHIKQMDNFSDVDIPGRMRHHDYSVNVEAKDADGNIIAGTAKGKAVDCGDGNPYKFTGYYATMEITPEGQGDYIQFTIGGQSWTSKQKTGRKRCNVGGWNRPVSPANRNMDCFFDC